MLEDLLESFILQLANIDPVVGMISKKLHKSCSGSRIDAWKYITPRARYIETTSNLSPFDKVSQGLRSFMTTKAVSSDRGFTGFKSDNSIYEAVEWACTYDIPHIIDTCLADFSSDDSYLIRKRLKNKLIWFDAGNNGSIRVLNWFLKHISDKLKRSTPYISGKNTKTVEWRIENLFDYSSCYQVNRGLMKVSAIAHKNIDSANLIDWVVIPHYCPLDDANCGVCTACKMHKDPINSGYFYPYVESSDMY